MHWQWGWTPVFFILTEGEICEITGPAAQLTEDRPLKVSGRSLHLCSLILVLFHAVCIRAHLCSCLYVTNGFTCSWRSYFTAQTLALLKTETDESTVSYYGLSTIECRHQVAKCGLSTLSYGRREQQQILNFLLWSSPSAATSPPLYPVIFIIDCSLHSCSNVIV